MFDLELVEPIQLQQAKATKRRIPENHPKREEVGGKIRILGSGFKGEKTLEYYLKLLPEKKYHIFQGLRLPIGKSFFQIDAFLYSPKLSFIIESKNHAGTLTIEKHQMIQEWNDKKVNHQNPLTQANRHKILLKYFFEKYQIPEFPIEYLAVATNSATKLNIAEGYTEAERKVCKAGDLLKRIEELEKFYKKESIDQKTMTRVKKLLLSKHTPLKTDFLHQLGIDKSEIITGVQCPLPCLCIPMQYYRKNWKCLSCGCISKDAYIEAINDYFLLIKPTITNSELRRFLQITSSRSATYLFSLINLPHSGIKKGRIYHQP